MAQPRASAQNRGASQPRQYPPRPPAEPREVVDPIWLLKAFLIVVAVALLCGYGSLCLLFYQGQWQLILHPARSAAVPPAIAGTPVQLIRFSTDESGIPQLTGWRIPAAQARYGVATVLFLPSGSGSLVDDQSTLAAIHDAGLNIFAVDYRGYGERAAIHPSEARMTEDAEAAFRYLTSSDRLSEAQIAPFGVGLGGSLAVHLAAMHPAIPAIIIDSPGPDPLETVLHDPRTRSLPVRALLHERFLLREPLATLRTPKLLIAPEGQACAFAGAATPKMTVSLPPSSTAPQVLSAAILQRFLDQYLPPATPNLPKTTSPQEHR